MTKEIIVEVFKAAGISDKQMKAIHSEFEKRHPAEHADFLKYLGISDKESLEIRKASR